MFRKNYLHSPTQPSLPPEDLAIALKTRYHRLYPAICEELAEVINKSFDQKCSEAVRAVDRFYQKYQDTNPGLNEVISTAINTPILLRAVKVDFPTTECSLTAWIIRYGHSSHQIDRLAVYGIDPEQKVVVSTPSGKKTTYNMASWAILQPSEPDKLNALARAGINFNTQNESGENIIQEFTRGHTFHDASLRTLLEFTNPSVSDTFEETSLCQACKNGQVSRVAVFLKKGFPTPTALRDQKYIIYEKEGPKTVDFTGMGEEIGELISRLQNKLICPKFDTNDLLIEAIVLGGKGNLYDSYLYLRSIEELTGTSSEKNGEAFAQLCISAFSKHEIQDIHFLFYLIEFHNDSLFYVTPTIRDLPPEQQHRFSDVGMAELLLLLTHPDLQKKFDPEKVSPITKAVTSAARWYDFGRETIEMGRGGWITLSNWERIGQITHGALHHRFLTNSIHEFTHPANCWNRVAPSLIEEFGFGRFQRRSPAEERRYGQSFVLLPGSLEIDAVKTQNDEVILDGLNPETFISFNRGHYIISHPVHGSMVIRNSSLVFGRNTMRYPAYYAEQGINNGIPLNELLNFSPAILEEYFSHALSRHLNGVKNDFDELRYRKRNDNAPQMMFLLDQFYIVHQALQRFVFDTNPNTAFRTSASFGQEMIGGFNSPGFKHLVHLISANFRGRQLELLETGKTTVPGIDLAAVHPYSPPWSPYPFIIDRAPYDHSNFDGPFTRFTLDEERLNVLESLANFQYDPEAFRRSGLKDFLQLAMTNQAALVMLPSLDHKLK